MVEPASASIGLYGAFKIAKDVGTQAYRLFYARSAAEWHLLQLRRSQLELGYWNSYANNFKTHGSSIPEERLQALIVNASDFELATQKYDEKVKKWCRRLSVAMNADDAGATKDETPTLWVSSDPFHHLACGNKLDKAENAYRIKNQGWRLCLTARIGFVVYGDFVIKQQAREAAVLQQLLSIKCVAESHSAAPLHINSQNPVERRKTGLMQFIARAQDRVRNENPINYYKLSILDAQFPDAQYEYNDTNLLDPRMEDFAIPEYALPRASLVPIPQAAQHGLEPIEHLIIIRRSPLLAISEENYESEAAKIARLFAEDKGHSKSFLANRPDEDVLRCCGIVQYPGQGCDLLFRIPPGSNPYPCTLRQLLTDPRSSNPMHPLSDRIIFSIRIIAGLLVVHSLGLVHKQIYPETIVVIEPLPVAETDVFPYRLGHPYLTSLQLARTDNGKTKKRLYKEAIKHRGVYIHPRDQYVENPSGLLGDGSRTQEPLERRLDEYRMRDDIFSTGVCLFEVICFRSLLAWKEKEKTEAQLRGDYVYDDSFVPLSDGRDEWKELTPGERARRKAAVLIENVKEKVPKVLGQRIGKQVAEIIVSFLRAGYDNEAFGVSLKDKSDTEENDRLREEEEKLTMAVWCPKLLSIGDISVTHDAFA